MKNIKLIRLSVSNFKGIKQFTFEPDGKNCAVYGANGLGKSSLADALNWLLFDKNQAGQKDFGLKPTDENGQEIHNLEHVVEAVLEKSEGNTVSRVILRKVMTEKWTKKRSSASPEFSGHEAAYFVDEVPTAKNEFDALVDNIAFGDVFRLLTSTTYFNTMKWQDRRLLLLRVAGDVSDADVIAANPSLAGLNEITEGRYIDYHMKKLKAQRPKVNTAIDAIVPRIAEAGRDKPNEASTIPTIGNYADLKATLVSLQNQRAALLAGDTSEIKSQIVAIQQEIQVSYQEHYEKKLFAEDEKRRFVDARSAIGLQLKNSKLAFESNREQRLNLERLLTDLRTKWAEVDARKAPSSECSLCGQVLPNEMAADVLFKFNSEKASELKAISQKAEMLKGELAALDISDKAIKRQISKLEVEYNMAQEAAEAIAIPAAPDYTLKHAAIAKLENEIANKATPDTAEIDDRIADVSKTIEQHDEAGRNLKRSIEIEKRVDELKAEQKRLSSELENIDREIMICENFTKAKVSMITDAVNAKFAPLSFKLFDQQINGGIAECCEVMARNEAGAMVPYSDLSRGQKAVAGLTVIKVLSEHYGITAPVFIEDTEGITLELPLVDGGQYIKLVADKAYNELTIKI